MPCEMLTLKTTWLCVRSHRLKLTLSVCCQETQRQLLQREAAAVSQRYVTSNEIKSIQASLRQLEEEQSPMGRGSAEIESLRADINGSQLSLSSLSRDLSRLDERLTGNLEGIRRMQAEIEQQLTEVCQCWKRVTAELCMDIFQDKV